MTIDLPIHVQKFISLNPNIYVELTTALIIAFVSFYIFFKTKEIYSLTAHKGLNYLRKAFLFFGLTATTGIILTSIITQFNLEPLKILFYFVPSIMLIGVLYTFFSLFWRDLKHEYYIYIIAILVSTINFLNIGKFIGPIIVSSLFITIGITSYRKHLKKRNNSKFNIYLVYMALFTFWALNFTRLQLALFLDYSGEVISVLAACTFIYIFFIFQKSFSQKNGN